MTTTPSKAADTGKTTIVEVAKLAGVSISGVSRAFNPDASCSEAMREKVRRAAQQLGYQPNRLARGIRAASRLIGILVTDFENPAYLPILNDFTRTLQQQGYHSLLINVGENMAIHEAVKLVMEYQVDGLIVTSSALPQELASVCQTQHTPVIIFGRHSRHAAITSVCCDNIAGGRLAADTLSAAGYQNFAYISGVPGATTTLERERGFIGRLVELGHTHWQVAEGGRHSYDSGYQAVLKLFSQPETPDALFFTNDIMACGGMDALRYTLQHRVPEDVGVIGFDDTDSAGQKAYDLTTIRQPFGEMVKDTIQYLIKEISTLQLKQASGSVPKKVVLPGALIQRGSVR